MKKGKSAGDAKSSSMSWGPLIVLCIAFFILVFDTNSNEAVFFGNIYYFSGYVGICVVYTKIRGRVIYVRVINK